MPSKIVPQYLQTVILVNPPFENIGHLWDDSVVLGAEIASLILRLSMLGSNLFPKADTYSEQIGRMKIVLRGQIVQCFQKVSTNILSLYLLVCSWVTVHVSNISVMSSVDHCVASLFIQVFG